MKSHTKQIAIVLGFLLCAYAISHVTVHRSLATPSEAITLQDQLSRHFAQFHSVELTYFAREDYFPSPDHPIFENIAKEVEEIKQVIERRLNGLSTNEDEEQWGELPIAFLQEMIESRRKITEWKPRDAVYVFSLQGDYARTDMIRIEHPEDSIVYLQGPEGCRAINFNGLIESPSFNTVHHHVSQMGMYGLGFFFNKFRDAQITDVNPERDRWIVRDFSDPRNVPYTFIGLEENPLYWKEFHIGNESDLSTKVFCEDFVNHSGLLVPQIVRITKPTRIWSGETVQHPIVILTLIDVRVNEECEFNEGHFEGANLPFMEDVYLKEYRYFERPIGE